jgi:hypothetical protein
MERYSRVCSSKWQSIYSKEFKRFVCNDYLTGSMTKSEVEIPMSRIYNIKQSLAQNCILCLSKKTQTTTSYRYGFLLSLFLIMVGTENISAPSGLVFIHIY